MKLPQGSNVLLAGMITGMQQRTVQKNGKRWAMLFLEDFTGQAKCILWSEVYAQYKDKRRWTTRSCCSKGRSSGGTGPRAGDVIVKRVLNVDQAQAGR